MHLPKALLVIVVAAACGFSSASPVFDMQMQDSPGKRDSAPRPLHLARRDATGRQTRHLRPEAFAPQKRDAPDLGQIATFPSGVPEPVRGALGASFLSKSNTAIDMQNIDNVAAPPTDAGTLPL